MLPILGLLECWLVVPAFGAAGPVPLAAGLKPAFERQALQARSLLREAAGLETVDID
jgi:hypothetical protein